MKKYIAIFILLIFVFHVGAQTRDKSFQINQLLGRGINFGNMLEAPSEIAWGNQWQPEYPGIISGLGFQHVRIPIRWEPLDRSQLNPPYSIQTTFLNRIKQVVDSTLNNGLYAIINMHHHDSLYNDPEGQKDRFLAQWKQISEFFKNYPDSLVFEILNEPHGNLTPEKWNVFLKDALTVIREDNPTRIVMIGSPEYGGLVGLPEIEIPDDEYIILTVHYYNPFKFTHQGASWVGDQSNDWLGTEWYDAETERDIIRNEFSYLITLGEGMNIPIHIGEFGAYSMADLSSRARWTTFLSRYFEQLGWSWAYWEFSAGFGIYNPDTKAVNQELVNALIHNEMPEPARFIGDVIYKSNFKDGDDNWNLYTQGSGIATLTSVDSTLQIIISNGSSESWHIQLSKNNFSLQDGKKYRLTFKAKSDTIKSINAYVGMSSSPWTAYSDASGFVLSDTLDVYSFFFEMNASDSNARIVFDLGKSMQDVIIYEVVLEEIHLEPQTAVANIEKISTRVFPNPITNVLNIQNNDGFTQFSIWNIQGKMVKYETLYKGNNSINMEFLSSGIYLILLNNNINKYIFRVMKL